MKTCTACKEEKDFSFFGKSASTKDGYAYVCSACRKEKSAAFYLANKDKLVERNKKWMLENKEKHRAYLKDWYESNKERVLAEDKEWYRNNKQVAADRDRKWRENNPGKVRERTANRREAVRKASPAWLTDNDKQNIRLIYKQAAEREKQTNIKYHVDHIVPLRAKNVCGLHVAWNLQVIPATENLIKNNKLAAALSA